jgi:hypothetical protein
MTGRHLEHNEIVHWSTVDLADDGTYVARDVRGRLVGRYENLKAAMAALPVLR